MNGYPIGIGFIGLGVMGEAMCRNLVRKGRWPVTVFDLRPEPVARLTAEGAMAAVLVEELAGQCDLVILCLPGGDEVRKLVLNDGLLAHMRAGQVLVDMSTSPPALMRDIAGLAADKDVRFADAPVARTRAAAVDGTLAIMVGAEEELFAALKPVLSTMGSDVMRCGGAGAGQVVKIMNNLVLFETVAALTEAVSVAEAQGVNGETLLDVMSKGSGNSFALVNHGCKSIVPQDYPEQAFSVRYAAKDLAYALDMAGESGVRVPGATSLSRLFDEAIEAGDGERYFPVIRRLLTGPRRT